MEYCLLQWAQRSLLFRLRPLSLQRTLRVLLQRHAERPYSAQRLLGRPWLCSPRRLLKGQLRQRLAARLAQQLALRRALGFLIQPLLAPTSLLERAHQG